MNGQDNSWKYEGETGLVRLVLDVEKMTFTLESWQMCLIGSPAQEQEGEIGKKLWDDCIKIGIEARKSVFKNCSMLKPFIPRTINNKKNTRL